jgi:hypothetical protein
MFDDLLRVEIFANDWKTTGKKRGIFDEESHSSMFPGTG